MDNGQWAMDNGQWWLLIDWQFLPVFNLVAPLSPLRVMYHEVSRTNDELVTFLIFDTELYPKMSDLQKGCFAYLGLLI